jgi:hypothetical protein
LILNFSFLAGESYIPTEDDFGGSSPKHPDPIPNTTPASSVTASDPFAVDHDGDYVYSSGISQFYQVKPFSIQFQIFFFLK